MKWETRRSKSSILPGKTRAEVVDTTKNISWMPLNTSRSELCLPLTFPTGQTFRWKQTGPRRYSGALGPHLFSLRHHDNDDVYYVVHTASAKSAAKSTLLDFLNVNISLASLWENFSVADSRFAVISRRLEGARVLRQSPLECLMQFLCSSNNNILRITKMVDFISSLGRPLGNVEGIDFHEFPSLDRLALVTEQQLRHAGFGYRAKYIIGAVAALRSKPGGGECWLTSLREVDLHVAIDALCTLPGVGPKVAACVALYSLDKHHAVPVDTHVWQIATRFLAPELAGARLTTKLCQSVADAFVDKYGKYAGWAQTLLFIADLPSQRAAIPASFWTKVEGEHVSGNKPGEQKPVLKILEADECSMTRSRGCRCTIIGPKFFGAPPSPNRGLEHSFDQCT